MIKVTNIMYDANENILVNPQQIVAIGQDAPSSDTYIVYLTTGLRIVVSRSDKEKLENA